MTQAPGRAADDASGPLELVVVAEGTVTSRMIPRVGMLTLGRSREASVYVADPSVSRKHAALHVEVDGLYIEDLDSVNGTTVRGAPLAPGSRIPIAVGETVLLGDVTVMVQRVAGTLRPRRIWLHDYFEARLEEECLRAERVGGMFSLIRIHCASPSTDPIVRDALTSVLRVYDVVGCYAPGEFEILLVSTPADRAAVAAERIKGRLDDLELGAGVGLASCPADGRGPDALQEAASRRAHDHTGTVNMTRAVDTPPSPMNQLYEMIGRIAPTPTNVLILGETGVGKEVLAERIHAASDRADSPFLRLNCAALSESLLESELFGHERGVVTGTIQTKRGLLETANAGTVFLDEIGELPLSLQVKLLRVIEERKVLPVGGLEPRSINVRFLAATNRNLEIAAERGTFRQDLYFRLNGATIKIPPLRERVGEIEPLVYQFVASFAQQLGRPGPLDLAEEAMTLLKWYSWPGNIRELRNIIERAVVLCGDDLITLEHLPVAKMRATYARAPSGPNPSTPTSRPAVKIPRPSNETGPRPVTFSPPPLPITAEPTLPGGAALSEEMHRLEIEADRLEKRRIDEALAACGGNQSGAARLLGISRGTLIKRLEKYGFPRPRQRRPEE